MVLGATVPALRCSWVAQRWAIPNCGLCFYGTIQPLKFCWWNVLMQLKITSCNLNPVSYVSWLLCRPSCLWYVKKKYKDAIVWFVQDDSWGDSVMNTAESGFSKENGGHEIHRHGSFQCTWCTLSHNSMHTRGVLINQILITSSEFSLMATIEKTNSVWGGGGMGMGRYLFG